MLEELFFLYSYYFAGAEERAEDSHLKTNPGHGIHAAAMIAPVCSHLYKKQTMRLLQGISNDGWMAATFLTAGGECRPSTWSDSASWASPWMTAIPSRNRSAKDWALRDRKGRWQALLTTKRYWKHTNLSPSLSSPGGLSDLYGPIQSAGCHLSHKTGQAWE